MGERVVVTGMGAVSPLGRGAAVLWEGLCAGKSGIGPLALFDASPFRSRTAGVCAGYPEYPGGLTRAVRMLRDAAQEAVDHAGAGASRPLPDQRCAVVVSTNFGGMSAAERALLREPPPQSSTRSLAEYLFGGAAELLAKIHHLAGPRLALSLSCASGTAAVGLGFDLIRSGRVEAALCCGYDELSLYCFAGLSALHAMTSETIRPFSKNRSGTIFSEGAGVIVLETLAGAQKRGKEPLVEVLGRAMNNDAYHMTAPEKAGHGIRRVMEMALQDARLPPEKIAHLNAHATGTKYNDQIETAAIKAVFGRHAYAMPITANKSMLGHAMGAAGSLEAISTIRTITDGVVPPTINLDDPDPELDLDYVPHGKREGRFDIAMNNSYGIGGTNAVCIFGRLS